MPRQPPSPMHRWPISASWRSTGRFSRGFIPGGRSSAAFKRSERGIPMAVGKVSDADFDTEVLKAAGPVVVDFWAEWCGPCRMIAPALDEISGAMGDKVKIVKLNV